MSDLPFDIGSGQVSSHAFLQALIELVSAINNQTVAVSGSLASPFTGDISGTPPGPMQVIATHLTAPLPVIQGGTGQTAFTSGQLLIGNSGGGLTKTTLTAPAAGITITSGSGTITFALGNDLAALEAMSGTGLVARTASETYAQRTITGTSNRITITNGTAVSGDPTIDIHTSYAGQSSITTLGTIATGTWQGSVIGSSYGGAGTVNGVMQANGSGTVSAAVAGTDYATVAQAKAEFILLDVSRDETTPLSPGVAFSFRMPFAMTLTAVRASLSTANSAGGPVTIDIKETGSTIFSTKLTINDTEKTSTTATIPAVISDSSLADDSEITIVIDDEGSDGAGLKVIMFGTRA